MGAMVNPKVAPGGSALGQQAFGAQGQQGGALAGMGGQMFGQGQGQLQQSGRYFSTLAGGNRAAMTQALSPDIGNINSVYGGTARTLSRFLRGPEKDVQMGEAERQRAGAVSGLFSGGRMNANASLAGMGASSAGQGIQATGGAGSIFGNMAKTAQDAQIAQNQEQQQAGAGIGSLFMKLLPAIAAPFTGGASLAAYAIPGVGGT